MDMLEVKAVAGFDARKAAGPNDLRTLVGSAASHP
jgi:hypothetical protein